MLMHRGFTEREGTGTWSSQAWRTGGKKRTSGLGRGRKISGGARME
jgi:hypothetical protein